MARCSVSFNSPPYRYCVVCMEKILIVDDDKFIQKVLNRFLKAEYEIKSAFNGDEALGSAYEWHPDIILLDVEMPGRSGYDVCDTLKRNALTRDTPVIFLSSNGSIRERMLGYEVGADDYLVKPCENDELLMKMKIISQLSK